MASFQSAIWINKQPNTDPAKTSLTYTCCNDWTKNGALAFMRQPEEGNASKHTHYVWSVRSHKAWKYPSHKLSNT